MPLWGFCIYASIAKLTFMSPDSICVLWNKDFINTSQSDYYDVVFLGDSTINTAIMPELLSDSTINLSMIGTTAVDNYYTLETYLDNNKAPKDVFIGFMDYHIESPDFLWSVSGQANRFSWKQYMEIYKVVKMFNINSAEGLSLDHYWQDVFAYKVGFPNKYVSSVLASLGNGRYKTNKESYDNISHHLGRFCIMTNDEYVSEGGLAYTDYKVDDVQDYYFKRIIELCEKNDIRLHFIKMPLPNDMYYTDDYIDQVNGYYDSLLAGHENVEFVWYSADYPTTLFRDIYHMNQHGSLVFSDALKDKYADIFSYDAYGEDRVEALNEDIKLENNISYLFKWIAGKKYSVLIYDGIGYIGALNFEGSNLQGTNVPALYWASFDNGDNPFITASDENAINVVTTGDEAFNIEPEGKMVIVIYDGYQGKIVRKCSLGIDPETGGFSTLEELQQ